MSTSLVWKSKGLIELKGRAFSEREGRKKGHIEMLCEEPCEKATGEVRLLFYKFGPLSKILGHSENLTELLLHVLWACNSPKSYLVKFTQIFWRFSLHKYKSSMFSLQLNQVTKMKIENNPTHQKQLMLTPHCVSF